MVGAIAHAVRMAATEAEREAIYRFRYQVYVEEMGKLQLPDADHAQRRLTDPLDDHAELLFVAEAEAILATLRVVQGAAHLPESLREAFRLASFSGFEDRALSFTSRLMMAVGLRGTGALNAIVGQTYATALERGVELDFCLAAPALVELYEHLGYRRYTENVSDEAVGYLVPLVLVVRDADHLRAIRSPLWRHLRRQPHLWESGSLAAARLRGLFPTMGEAAPWMLTEDNLWRFLASRLQTAHGRRVPLLDGLDEKERGRILTSGALLRCRRGDVIIQAGKVGRELFVILSGMVEVRLPGSGETVALFEAGEVFGEVAFIASTRRSADVIAVTDAEILVITQTFLKQLRKVAPSTAATLLLNLSRTLCERLVFSNRHVSLLQGHRAGLDDALPEPGRSSYTVALAAGGAAEIERLEAQAITAWPREQALLERHGLADAREVADFGCGPGRVSALMAGMLPPEARVTGFDIAPSLLDRARAVEPSGTGATLTFETGSVYALPVSDGRFDFAYMRFLIQHLAQPLHAMAEARRVLRPGGKLLVVDNDDGLFSIHPEPPALRPFLALVAEAQSRLGGDREAGRKLPFYLREAGFERINTEVLLIDSETVPMESFLAIATGAKLTFLSAEERERGLALHEAIVSHARATAALARAGVYAVSGVVPG